MYKIIQTEFFESDFNKTIPGNLKKHAKEKINSLRLNPERGKMLSYSFLRELKVDKFRIYYMVYKDIITILLVAIGDKKTQKRMIDGIKKKRESLKVFAHNYKKYLNNGG